MKKEKGLVWKKYFFKAYFLLGIFLSPVAAEVNPDGYAASVVNCTEDKASGYINNRYSFPISLLPGKKSNPIGCVGCHPPTLNFNVGVAINNKHEAFAVLNKAGDVPQCYVRSSSRMRCEIKTLSCPVPIPSENRTYHPTFYVVKFSDGSNSACESQLPTCDWLTSVKTE